MKPATASSRTTATVIVCFSMRKGNRVSGTLRNCLPWAMATILARAVRIRIIETDIAKALPNRGASFILCAFSLFLTGCFGLTLPIPPGVHAEVPKRHHGDGQEVGYIEIPSEPGMEELEQDYGQADTEP